MVNNLGYNVNVYGLGERVTDFKLGNGNYTLWAKDYTNNSGNGMNMYSSQPFYLATDGTGNAFGGFLCNSNAMEVVIGSQSIEYRTTGGIIDMFVFAGPCPSAVIH